LLVINWKGCERKGPFSFGCVWRNCKSRQTSIRMAGLLAEFEPRTPWTRSRYAHDSSAM